MTENTLKIPGVEVVRLHEQHLSEVVELMNAEGWYYYDRHELRRYLDLNQDCFVLLKDDHVVGSIFTTNYGNQAWIGNIVVARELRGMGLATHLIRRVMEHLHETKQILTFRLGSVPLAIGVYKKVGFQAEAFTTAQEASLPLKAEIERLNLGENMTVEPFEERDLEDAAEIDTRFFKSNRLQLLTNLYNDSIKEGCFCLKDHKKVVGFLMVRRRQASKDEGGFAEGPDYAYRLGPSCVLPEYGIDGFKALFQKSIPVVNEEVARLGGSARMYVVFPRSADKSEIHADTRELAAAMGMDADIDLDSVFDEHEFLFGAKQSTKNQDQWEYMESLGFHQEYFEQVMSYAPGEAQGTQRPQSQVEMTVADPAGIFASATPGDKA